MSRRIPVRGRRGFGLVELVVIIGIIAVLIALLAPAIQSVREAAPRPNSGLDLRLIGVGVRMQAESDLAEQLAKDLQQDLIDTLTGKLDPMEIAARKKQFDELAAELAALNDELRELYPALVKDDRTIARDAIDAIGDLQKITTRIGSLLELVLLFESPLPQP